MTQLDLKTFLKETIEEALSAPWSNYSWDVSSKELTDDEGNKLTGKDGKTLTFNSETEAEEYLETNDIHGSLKEMTGTGAVAGYGTPFAFAGPGDEKRKKDIAARSMPGGKVVGDITETILEGRGRYHNFKEDKTVRTHEAKVSYLVAEVHKMLKEVSFLVNMSNRLKEETGVQPKWKRTQKDIVGICNHIKEISKKIKHIN